jgi:hypothetical protein
MGWYCPAERVYATTCPGWTVPVSTAAVVPVVKFMTPGTGVGVTVGRGVGVGGLEVGVARGGMGVGLGGMGVGLPGVGVGATESGRLQPAKSIPDTARAMKMDQGLI